MSGTYVVNKLGGDITGSPEYMRQAAGVLAQQIREGQRPLVVVSACRGVTDALIRLYEAKRRVDSDSHGTGTETDAFYRQHVPSAQKELRKMHYRLLEGVCNSGNRYKAKKKVDATLAKLMQDIQTAGVSFDKIVTCGEILAEPVAEAVFTDCGLPVHCLEPDETPLIVNHNLSHLVDFGATEKATRVIVPYLDRGNVGLQCGYFGIDNCGIRTALPRGASDTVAVVMGTVLLDSYVNLWKTTEGVMSADPRIVPNARNVPALCYPEAIEAGRVVQPDSIALASGRGKALTVRSLEHPEVCTTINHEGDCSQEVKIISLSEGERLFYISSPALVNASSFPYDAFSKRGINITILDSDSAGSAFVVCKLNGKNQDAIGDVQHELEQQGYHTEIQAVNPIRVIGHHISPETVGRINDIVGHHALIGARPRWANVYSAAAVLPDSVEPKQFVRQLHKELIG